MDTYTVIEIPLVHLNGTSGNELLEQNNKVIDAVRSLLEALKNAAPNGRDYYIKNIESFRCAQSEHRDRVERINSVLVELEKIKDGIYDQIQLRQTRQRGRQVI